MAQLGDSGHLHLADDWWFLPTYLWWSTGTHDYCKLMNKFKTSQIFLKQKLHEHIYITLERIYFRQTNSLHINVK